MSEQPRQPQTADDFVEDVPHTLAEFRELSEDNDGRIFVERSGWTLNPKDSNDASLIRLFDEAKLAPRPENWRLLLEMFAHYHYTKDGRKPSLKESDIVNLVRDAYLMEKALRLAQQRVSLPIICAKLCAGPKDYRVPAEYLRPQGKLNPKTLQKRLEAGLDRWDSNKDDPETERNYAFLPELFADVSMMVASLRKLRPDSVEP
jgi:hypothetical protein